MTRIGAAISLAAFAVISLAGAADAQTATMVPAGGGRAASAVASFAPARPAPHSPFGTREFPMLRGFDPSSDWRGSDYARFGYGRPGHHDGPDRPDRPDRPHRRHWRDHDQDGYGYAYGYGYGVGGLVDRRDGYFASGGETWRGRDGHVAYDYDRGYPYDHYRPREEQQAAYQGAPRERYCETQWARGGRSGERVPVTICRN